MASGLADYVASAQPVPKEKRIPWFSSTAQTYAGIMLWFVFWQDVPVGAGIDPAKGEFSLFAGGTLAQGLGVALLGVVLAALVCHFLFYLVPGMLGMKTGLPLYIVGTSTYGVTGGFLMPGFLMGLLQFGWLAVNAYFSAMLLAGTFGQAAGSAAHLAIGIVWAIVAAFVGLKGIQYVAKVATFLPLIPLVILVILLVSTIGGVAKFDANAAVQAGAAAKVVGAAGGQLTVQPALSLFHVIAVIGAYIVGFFATAGAAGCDFGMNNRDAKDVQLGGLVGIALATIFAGGISLLAVAGAQGLGKAGADLAVLRTTSLMGSILSPQMAKIFMFLLAVAAFPPACFSSFIAANSFKTTLPKVNPFITCGLGTAAIRCPGHLRLRRQRRRRVYDHRRLRSARSAGRSRPTICSPARSGPAREPGSIPPAGSRGSSALPSERSTSSPASRSTCLARRWPRSSSASCSTSSLPRPAWRAGSCRCPVASSRP